MADDNGPADGTALASPVWDARQPSEIARRLAAVRAHWYETDFEAMLPFLQLAAVGWLREALARVDPGHAWLGAL